MPEDGSRHAIIYGAAGGSSGQKFHLKALAAFPVATLSIEQWLVVCQRSLDLWLVTLLLLTGSRGGGTEGAERLTWCEHASRIVRLTLLKPADVASVKNALATSSPNYCHALYTGPP